MNMDFFSKSEIEDNIARIEELLQSEIFHLKNSQSPFVRSAFIEILICLRDLMRKAEKYSSRITFNNDIVTMKYQERKSKMIDLKDVTDLIKYVRDALCHLNSPNHDIKNGFRATYNIIYGKGNSFKIGDMEQISDYDDDVCFFFGRQKIYLNRHIIKAFEEAKDKLKSFL